MAIKKTSIKLDEDMIEAMTVLYGDNISEAIRQLTSETLRVMKDAVQDLKVFTEKEIEFLWNVVNGSYPEFSRVSAKYSVILNFQDWVKLFQFRDLNAEDKAFIDKIDSLSEMEAIALVRYIAWFQDDNSTCIEKMKFLFMKEDDEG